MPDPALTFPFTPITATLLFTTSITGASPMMLSKFALSHRLVALEACAILVAVCTACSNVDRGDASKAAVSEWTVAAEPDLQIGVVDGDPDYQMHLLLSAVSLPDGNVAALNAGSHELRVYDAAGRLVSRTGRRGGGPGEFQRPLRLYRMGDTLAVFDEGAKRLSMHNLNGEFIGVDPLVQERGRFQWDQWLHDMSWIDGPPLGRGRAEVLRAVERLPAPDTTEGYRYVRVTPYGHLWVRQPAAVDATMRTWHVHDLSGAQIARVQVPAEFEIHDFGDDYLLGRARDTLGVEYLRRYRLETGEAIMALHAFVEDTTVKLSEPDTAVLKQMQSALRMLTAHQELYYSNPANNYRYADDLRKLSGYEIPEDVTIRIVTGHATGWTAIAMHRPTETMCGMAVGTTAPVGWTPGVIMCN